MLIINANKVYIYLSCYMLANYFLKDPYYFHFIDSASYYKQNLNEVFLYLKIINTASY